MNFKTASLPLASFCLALSCLTPKTVESPQLSPEEKFAATDRIYTPNRIENADDFHTWFTFYYLDPKPELTPKAVRFMEAKGFLRDDPEVVSAFLMQVFSQNPKSLKLWLNSWQDLKTPSWDVILISLSFVDHAEVPALLDQYLHKSSPEMQHRLGQWRKSPHSPNDLLGLTIIDSRQIPLLWAAFSATGNTRYVHKVISYIHLFAGDKSPRSQIGEAALMTLAAYVLQHEVVAQVCTEQYLEHPAERTRRLLQAMLAALIEMLQAPEEGLAH